MICTIGFPQKFFLTPFIFRIMTYRNDVPNNALSQLPDLIFIALPLHISQEFDLKRTK